MSLKILFLCKGNSARSQMAEALVNTQYSDRFVAFSAGTNPAEHVNPYAIRTMNNLGIDISRNIPKSIDNYADGEFDFIITLCSKGKEQCIKFAGKPIFSHWDMPDPVDFTGTELEIMQKFSELLKFLTTRIRYLASISPAKLEALAAENRTLEVCPIEG